MKTYFAKQLVRITGDGKQLVAEDDAKGVALFATVGQEFEAKALERFSNFRDFFGEASVPLTTTLPLPK